MRTLFISAEAFPLAKTGGLADVSRALPLALREQGADVRLLMPGYPSALERLADTRVEMALDGILGIDNARLIGGRLPDTQTPVWLVDAPDLYVREGGIYLDAQGAAWRDNARRFAYLSHVGARLGMGLAADGWKPDVVHANDWHAGLAPLILSSMGRGRPSTVFTIHNMAFQGNFPAEIVPHLGLPADCFATDGLEYYGQASFLKAGIRYSDKVTTVSPTYRREVLTPEFGLGLEGLLKRRGDDFIGILNGVESAIWNPACDPCLPARFDANDLSGKRQCKLDLQRELGLAARPETPLLAFVSRLTRQKMADVVLDALAWFADADAQLIILSEGDVDLEAGFRAAERLHPGKVAVRIGYEEALAHRIHAGADMVLAPARFEPCGLTQLYAMRYGALPIVRRVGGLADTVTGPGPGRAPAGCGFLFDGADLPSMIDAIERATSLFREPLTWRRMQLNAMARDFSWEAGAARYLSLYRSLVGPEAETPRSSAAAPASKRLAATI